VKVGDARVELARALQKTIFLNFYVCFAAEQ